IEDTAAQGRASGGQAVRNRQAADGHVGRAAAEAEYTAEMIAAEGQLARAGAADAEVVGDAQLAAAQRDGAAQASGEVDRVRPRRGVGSKDRLAEGAGAAVGEVQDREGAGEGPVFEQVE